MTPGYYRPRVPGWVWAMIGIAVGLFVIVKVSGLALDAIRQEARDSERQKVYAETNAAANIGWPVERAALQRRIDSLRNTVVVHDSAAGAAMADARFALAALSRQLDRTIAQRSTRTDTISRATDDSLITTAQTAIRACTVAISRCDSLRAIDRATLDSSNAAHQAIHAKDSLEIRARSVDLVITRDTLGDVRRDLNAAILRAKSGPNWFVVGGATITGAVIGVAFCALLCP